MNCFSDNFFFQRFYIFIINARFVSKVYCENTKVNQTFDIYKLDALQNLWNLAIFFGGAISNTTSVYKINMICGKIEKGRKLFIKQDTWPQFDASSIVYLPAFLYLWFNWMNLHMIHRNNWVGPLVLCLLKGINLHVEYM